MGVGLLYSFTTYYPSEDVFHCHAYDEAENFGYATAKKDKEEYL